MSTISLCMDLLMCFYSSLEKKTKNTKKKKKPDSSTNMSSLSPGSNMAEWNVRNDSRSPLRVNLLI